MPAKKSNAAPTPIKTDALMADMAGHPIFLLWRAQADPDNVGGRRIDLRNHFGILFRRQSAEGRT